MEESSSGDGVGIDDGATSAGGVIDREVTAIEPQKVRIALKVRGNDGTEKAVKDNFALLRGTNASSGQLTTNPDFLKRILEKGPLAFDEAREQGQDPTLKVLPESTALTLSTERGWPELINLTVDSDGNIVYIPESILAVEPFETGSITASVVEGGQSESPDITRDIREIKLMIFDGQKYPYGKMPQLQEAYRKLGFKSGFLNGQNVWSFPPPHLLAERLSKLREEDNESGLYYPEIEIFEQRKITSTDFDSAFAAEKFPVSGVSFEYYIHDIAQEHFQALMVYGKPLMDLMSNFASAMQSLDTIILPGFDSSKINKPGITDLQGKDKDDATGHILDDMTGKLIGRDFETLYEYGGELGTDFEQITYALRKAGKFTNLRLVSDILKDGEAANADEITGQMIANKLITSTRNRFALAA